MGPSVTCAAQDDGACGRRGCGAMRPPPPRSRRQPGIAATGVRRAVLGLVCALVPLAPAAAQETSPPVSSVIEALPRAHPADYYALAARLFEEGARDAAVFWFYAGQLRFRLHLMAQPGLAPDGDPALFASLSEVVGRPLNAYGAGDIEGLVATLDAVLEWDLATPNLFTDRDRHAVEWQRVRAGLTGLRDHFAENADDIRAERAARGLENR